ncbi:hypothetical protein J6590_102291, partial [Homalodisca vitripennis]
MELHDCEGLREARQGWFVNKFYDRATVKLIISERMVRLQRCAVVNVSHDLVHRGSNVRLATTATGANISQRLATAYQRRH